MDNLPLTTEPFLTGKPLKVWLDSMGIKDWSMSGGLVDVKGDVTLEAKLGDLKRLPVRFGNAAGNFWCGHNQLVNLEGAPEKVSGDFWCDSNQLVSLEGAPKNVGWGFYCHDNQLVSLEGAPEKVGGGFYCNCNQLVSLEGAPAKVRSFWCSNNNLVSLKGSPAKVDAGFSCYSNQLVSLDGAPKQVGGSFYCHHNLLVDFKGMEGVSVMGRLFVTDLEIAGQDNVFVSLESLPKELHCKVVGLDVAALLASEHLHSGIPDIEI